MDNSKNFLHKLKYVVISFFVVGALVLLWLLYGNQLGVTQTNELSADELARATATAPSPDSYVQRSALELPNELATIKWELPAGAQYVTMSPDGERVAYSVLNAPGADESVIDNWETVVVSQSGEELARVPETIKPLFGEIKGEGVYVLRNDGIYSANIATVELTGEVRSPLPLTADSEYGVAPDGSFTFTAQFE